jgi:hypothetical protein
MLRTMRANPAWLDVPVVIITSKDLNGDERDWLRRNTMEVLQKGAYGRAELVAALRGMIEGVRRRRSSPRPKSATATRSADDMEKIA